MKVFVNIIRVFIVINALLFIYMGYDAGVYATEVAAQSNFAFWQTLKFVGIGIINGALPYGTYTIILFSVYLYIKNEYLCKENKEKVVKNIENNEKNIENNA